MMIFVPRHADIASWLLGSACVAVVRGCVAFSARSVHSRPRRARPGSTRGLSRMMGAVSGTRREAFNRTVHGARGLFAGIVLFYHAVNSGLPSWLWLQWAPLQFVLRMTGYGVELFFCISGFVIVGTLRRAPRPVAFMQDRLIRIYPVLWVTILAIVVLGVASGAPGYGAATTHPLAWLQIMG